MRDLHLHPHISGSTACHNPELGEARHSLIDRRFLNGSQELPRNGACKRIRHQSSEKRSYVVFSKLAMFEVPRERSSQRSMITSRVASNSVIMPADLALRNDASSLNTTSTEVDFRRTKDSVLGNSAQSNFQAPFPTSNIKNLHTLGLVDLRNERNARRRSRERGPSLPLSQCRNHRGGGMFMSTVGAMGPPVTRMGRLQGPIGVLMALVVAVIAISTATKRRLLAIPDQHQKRCSKCDGSGLQLCSICKGCGRVEWEGKLRHFDPCPLCFGSCYEKCPACGGNIGSFNLWQLLQNMKGKEKK